MIRPKGRPSEIIRPTAFANGVALSSFNVNFTVGMIPKAQVGMPVEELWKFNAAGPDTEVKVVAMDSQIFSGYINATAINLSGESLSSSSVLIHKARDLDESSMFGPGAHPASTEDFTMVVAFLADSKGGGGAEAVLGRRDLELDIKGNMGESIVGYIKSAMKHLSSASKIRNIPPHLKYAMQTLEEGSPRAMKALESLVVDGGCQMPGGGFQASLSDAASAFARNMVFNAMGTGRSPWSVMSGLMSAFGLTIICMPDGTAVIAPDYSGCKPPGSNSIQSSIVSRFSQSSSNSRPPSAVLAVGYGVYSADYSNPMSHAPVASYTPKQRPSSTSGVLTVGLPSWMIPASRSDLKSPPPPVPSIIGESWAKQIYYQEANINRSMSVSMPFSPDVVPGTTYRVFPSSSARFLSGGSADVSKSYSGYCYSVTHSLTPDSNDISTTAMFRNIFEDTEEGAMISGAAMFSDQKPFSVPY